MRVKGRGWMLPVVCACLRAAPAAYAQCPPGLTAVPTGSAFEPYRCERKAPEAAAPEAARAEDDAPDDSGAEQTIPVDCSRPELGPDSGFRRLRREEPEYEGVMDVYSGRGRKLRTTCFQDGGITLDLEFTPKLDPALDPKLTWYRETADFLDQVMSKGRHAVAWKAISRKIRRELKKKKPDLRDLPKENVSVENGFVFGGFGIAPDKNTVQAGQVGFFGQVKEGELRGTHLLEISWRLPEEENAD